MPDSLSVEDRLFAANQLLIRVNQLRDFAENRSLETSGPSPIELWLSEYEQPLSGLSQPFVPVIDRFLSLLQVLRSERNPDRTTSQLFQALESAVRAITESDRVQEAIARRVEQAVYDFAYGLSHEINNPLANISARAQQLILDSNDERAKKSLATIVDQSQRAYEMLAEMMQVAKPQPIPVEKTDLQHSLQLALGRVAPLGKAAQVQIEIESAPTAFYVESNRAALPDALVSLLQNALEASRPGDQVQVAISLPDPVELENMLRTSSFSAASGSSTSHIKQLSSQQLVSVKITDSGCGMSPKVASNAFNVYFSGREHGRGLGISLAKVKRTIESTGGLLYFSSAQATGTRVTLLLPMSSEQYEKTGFQRPSKLFA